MTREPEELLKRWWSNQTRLFNKDRGVAGLERVGSLVPGIALRDRCGERHARVRDQAPNEAGARALAGRLASMAHPWERVRIRDTVPSIHLPR